MNIYEVFFLLGFLCMVIITLCKFYNVLTMAKWMDWKHSLIAFVGVIMLWYMTFVSFMANISNYQLVWLLNYGNAAFILTIILSLVEVTIHISEYINEKTKNLGFNRKRYVPSKN